MKKNFIQFLFGESQVDDEIAGIVESISDLNVDSDDDLRVEKKPLAKALADLGIEAKSLENDPRGLSLVFTVPEEYRAAHAILNEPDSLYKLASLGWVFSTQGDVAMANEPAELRIRFLEIDEISPADAKAVYSDSDKARLNKVRDIVKKGREFATEEPDFDYEENPVSHAGPKKGKHDKGVGSAKDGSDPEGTPKGSEGGIKTGSAGAQPGKGDLTQPEEGAKAKLVKESHLAGHMPDEIAGNADYLQNNGILHAPGCGCDVCKADSIGMSSAASRKSRGRPGSLPGSPAAGHFPVGEGKHRDGCTCGFCKNKGNIALLRGGQKAKNNDKSGAENDTGVDTGVDETRTAEQIVSSMLEGNPGTPPGIMGTKSFPTMKLPGGSKDRKFRPAKGMVQAAPENSVVAAQTKPNHSA